VPLVLQAGRSECGLAALLMIARYHGYGGDMRALQQRCGNAGGAPDLGTMLKLADAVGLIGRPVRLDLADLHRLALPAVVHWEFNHFVVVTRVTRRGIRIHDPAIGRRRISWRLFADAFTGVAVEFTPGPSFASGQGRGPAPYRGLLGSFTGMGRLLAVMLVLLLVTQTLSLAPPVATQLLIDNIVLGAEQRWLYQVLAGIGLVMLTTLLIDALRRWIALYAGTRLATASTTAVISHLLRLPAIRLEQRPVGDLLSRVDSLRPIRNAITDTCVNGFVQVVVLATTLALMSWYSPRLTLVSAAALMLTLGLHAAYLPRMRALNLESVVAAARSSDSLIESLRACRTVEALHLESERLAHWQSHFVTATNNAARQQRIGIGCSVGQGLFATAEQLLFLAIGINGIVDRQLTLGILFAFLSLRGRLGGAAANVVAVVRTLFLLTSHVQRVGELLVEDAEPSPPAAVRRQLDGAVECRSVTFAHPGQPLLIDRLSCRIEAGESIVICGRSGVGKSTLLRLMSAGLRARSGSILYDGIEAELWDLPLLRRQFGVVLQQDRLFAGSIADNISCFDARPDIGRVREVARLAEVWQDVQAMPMRLQTPVIHGGAGLSGGQVQRILLARALYREPKVLFLDEATCHLDRSTETRVLDNLRSLEVTIVSISHGADAMTGNSRSIRLQTPG
jgi:ATP-binding cassette, subfamily B, bacterial CvaB/MchF/RaxB